MISYLLFIIYILIYVILYTFVLIYNMCIYSESTIYCSHFIHITTLLHTILNPFNWKLILNPFNWKLNSWPICCIYGSASFKYPYFTIHLRYSNTRLFHLYLSAGHLSKKCATHFVAFKYSLTKNFRKPFICIFHHNSSDILHGSRSISLPKVWRVAWKPQ